MPKNRKRKRKKGGRDEEEEEKREGRGGGGGGEGGHPICTNGLSSNAFPVSLHFYVALYRDSFVT